MLQFVTGQTYSTRSICDHDCIYSFTILKRTAKTVTIQDPDTSDVRTVRRGLYVYEGVEQFKPFGTYSMCAIIGADDKDPALIAALAPVHPCQYGGCDAALVRQSNRWRNENDAQ